VTRGAHVIARRHVGLASLAHRVPIGPRTRFHIVSVSKTFLAAAVLVLAARGALRLEDDVRLHLPELPPDISPGGALTIRHLLSMTSGLRDVLEIERPARRLGHGAVAHPRPARPRPADHRGQRASGRPVHVRQRERAAAGRS
jgi:CubicO group peptidase (beta-lactamase class C family)